jgi:DNA (cytosine-5)-methyltransferase 1
MTVKLIDLFCGCGGMTLGFLSPALKGKFRPVLAVDNDRHAVESYSANFGGHALCGGIEDILPQYVFPKADVVIGGPPCQGFSLLNRNRANDARRSLWRPFMEVVAKAGAKAFVIENVRQLHNSPECLELFRHAEGMGFRLASALLNSADYGVPQTRVRTIIIGFRRPLDCGAPELPEPSHSGAGGPLPKWRTVRDAISDLPLPVGTEMNRLGPPMDLHFGRRPTPASLLRYRQVPKGGNRFDLARNAPELTPRCWLDKKSGGTDLFGRLWWDRPSVTIRTEFFKPEKGRYLHPEQDRPITHREAARLMSFPDGFSFKGSKIDVARQIGNAVPPLLAGAIAESVARALGI